jgi:hypothetical protein
MVDRTFVAAGNATFTVEIPEAFSTHNHTPAHYTYRVRYKPAEGKWGEAWFVSLLTGPDNTSDYSYLGMLNAQTGEVRLTAKSSQSDASWSVRILRRVLTRLWAGQGEEIAAAGWKVHHQGKCGRCNRDLTVPESIERGIGPECWELMGMDG